MNITQIRNATLKIHYHNVKLLTDPWLMPKDFMQGFESAINSHIRQPRTELPMPVESIVDADAVIITHIHPDHWDEFAEKAIDKQTKIFVQNKTDRDFIKSKGFTDLRSSALKVRIIAVLPFIKQRLSTGDAKLLSRYARQSACPMMQWEQY